MTITLTVTRGPKLGRIIELREPCGLIIGRAPDAQIRITDDPYVSRRHAYLEISPPRCRLQDLSSTNPPHVNGEAVAACEITDGDVIEVGYTQFKVAISEEPVADSGHCEVCEGSLQALSSEAMPATCAVCSASPPAPTDFAAAVPRVCCASCSADLSRYAASDGRAAELADVAVYSCQAHLRPDEDCAGMTIRDYGLYRSLGEGAMGIVYLAYQQSTARLWALKQIKDLTSPVLAKRFEREVRLMQNVVHRNVVRCTDTGIDEQGVPYLVTEYVPDGSLEDAVQLGGGRLPKDEAVRIACGVLDGVEYLHARGIIHRDVKPANILLRGRGHARTPKLTDFGIAKSYANAGGTWCTKPGTRLGTLMFMPPEQVLDARKVGVAADTYAAGVTLYYMLTGHYSFDFPSPAEAAAFQQDQGGVWHNVDAALHALMRYRRIKHPFSVILEEDPVPVRKRGRSIPPALAEVVDRAVRKDPEERFQSAGELRKAIEPFS